MYIERIGDYLPLKEIGEIAHEYSNYIPAALAILLGFAESVMPNQFKIVKNIVYLSTCLFYGNKLRNYFQEKSQISSKNTDGKKTGRDPSKSVERAGIVKLRINNGDEKETSERNQVMPPSENQTSQNDCVVVDDKNIIKAEEETEGEGENDAIISTGPNIDNNYLKHLKKQENTCLQEYNSYMIGGDTVVGSTFDHGLGFNLAHVAVDIDLGSRRQVVSSSDLNEMLKNGSNMEIIRYLQTIFYHKDDLLEKFLNTEWAKDFCAPHKNKLFLLFPDFLDNDLKHFNVFNKTLHDLSPLVLNSEIFLLNEIAHSKEIANRFTKDDAKKMIENFEGKFIIYDYKVSGMKKYKIMVSYLFTDQPWWKAKLSK